MEHPSVYVASPLGFTEAGRRYLAGFLHPALEQAGFSILDPWSDPDGVVTATMAIEPSDPGRLAALAEMNRTLGKANAAAIADADVLLAVLDGADVDSGTASEVGYAAGIGVPVVGYRTDLRTSGDNEAATVNLQVEYFVEASGGSLCTTLATAIEAVMSAAERHLFHLARRTAWEEAIASGTYTASTRDQSLDEVGFIHFSFAHQLAATAQRHYGDLDPADLVLLTVDRRRLGSRLLVELAPGIGESFPHLYGPLNLDAVITAEDVVRGASGDLLPLG